MRQKTNSPGILSEIQRYGRALVLALRFTLRGEKPPLLKVRDQYPELTAWWTETIRLVEAVEHAAQVSSIDLAARTVRIDRREVRVGTILQAVRYHAEREYPYLMAHDEQFNALTLQATNLNDRYRVQRIVEESDAALKPAAEALGAHLGQMPNNSSS